MLLLLLACTDPTMAPPVPPPCDSTGWHAVTLTCHVEQDRPPSSPALDPPPVLVKRDVGQALLAVDGDCWAAPMVVEGCALDAGYVDHLAPVCDACVDEVVVEGW